MHRPRDSQRSRLYTAETEVPHGRHFTTISEVEAWLTAITHSAWCRTHFPAWWGKRVHIKDGRGTRIARGSRAGVINLPRWARSELVILHELAHVLQPHGTAAHGREFAWIYLAVVHRWMGKDAARQLRATFRVHRVKFYPQRSSRRQTTRHPVQQTEVGNETDTA